MLARKGLPGHICAKGPRRHALPPGQTRSTRAKSRKRVRGEHLFAFMTGSLRAMFQRGIGFARNRPGILLGNLGYNMAGTEQLIRLQLLGRRTPKLA